MSTPTEVAFDAVHLRASMRRAHASSRFEANLSWPNAQQPSRTVPNPNLSRRTQPRRRTCPTYGSSGPFRPADSAAEGLGELLKAIADQDGPWRGFALHVSFGDLRLPDVGYVAVPISLTVEKDPNEARTFDIAFTSANLPAAFPGFNGRDRSRAAGGLGECSSILSGAYELPMQIFGKFLVATFTPKRRERSLENFIDEIAAACRARQSARSRISRATIFTRNRFDERGARRLLHRRRRTGGNDGGIALRARRRLDRAAREARRLFARFSRRHDPSVDARGHGRARRARIVPPAPASRGDVAGRQSRRDAGHRRRLHASSHALQVRRVHAAVGFPQLSRGRGAAIPDFDFECRLARKSFCGRTAASPACAPQTPEGTARRSRRSDDRRRRARIRAAPMREPRVDRARRADGRALAAARRNAPTIRTKRSATFATAVSWR